MQLSQHFSLDEFTASDTAVRRGINNTPSEAVIANLRLTAEKLELVRSILKVPVILTSGFRCESLNTIVGGSRTSAHVFGLAADIRCPAFGPPVEVCRAILRHAESVDYDQLIYEGGWTHIGFAAAGITPRRDVRTANFVNGKAVYSKGIIG